MHALFTEPGRSAARVWQPREIDLADRPGIALLYALSGAVIEFVGPVFWATLIVLLIQAELLGK